MSHIIVLESRLNESPSQICFGIDLGKRFTGIAISNPEQTLAVPLEVIPSSSYSRLAKKIQAMMQTYNAKWIVLGLPLHQDNAWSKGCDRTQAFSHYLAPTPVCFWDEGFSTCALQKNPHAPFERKREDHYAAAIILQGALDRLHHLKCCTSLYSKIR